MILMKAEEEKCHKSLSRAQGKSLGKLTILLSKLKSVFNKNSWQTLESKLKASLMR